MWIVKLLQKLIGYLRAYLHGFLWSGVATRSQYTRLYFVSLAFAGAVLVGLFRDLDFLHSHPEFNDRFPCKPVLPVHFLALFVLAEVASFMFLLFSYAGLYIKGRPFSGQTAYHDLTTVGHRLEWRLYRLLWLWFPLVMLALGLLAAPDFRVVVTDCEVLRDARPMSLFSYKLSLLKSLMLPYLAIMFVAVVGVYWWFVRWVFTWRVAATLLLAFASYVVVIATVGPPDLFGVVQLARDMPETFQWAYDKLLK
jgi:hypothetical protein